MSGFDLKRAGVRYELGLELDRSFVSECSCERELLLKRNISPSSS